jgi:hypothetical protein
LAKARGGQPPGARLFKSETGIRESAWRGVHWARWSEAIAEAGLEPNTAPPKLTEQFILEKIAEAFRHFGKIPSAMEFRVYGRTHKGFPNKSTILRAFQSKENMLCRLAEFANANRAYSDIAAMLVDMAPATESDERTTRDGLVYLIRSGAYYKIGRSDQLERRVKEIRVALPEAAILIHSIRTDDPSGIEAYWHRRFDNRRAKGEWFKLTNADVTAFKRRKYQ